MFLGKIVRKGRKRFKEEGKRGEDLAAVVLRLVSFREAPLTQPRIMKGSTKSGDTGRLGVEVVHGG